MDAQRGLLLDAVQRHVVPLAVVQLHRQQQLVPFAATNRQRQGAVPEGQRDKVFRLVFGTLRREIIRIIERSSSLIPRDTYQRRKQHPVRIERPEVELDVKVPLPQIARRHRHDRVALRFVAVLERIRLVRIATDLGKIEC